MQLFLFLTTVFLCTGGFIATEVTVISLASSGPEYQNGPSAGAAVFFCVMGTLLASVSLRHLCKYNTRILAKFTAIIIYVLTALFWVLDKLIPLLIIAYIAAVLYSAVYIVVNYCLCVSVYHFEKAGQRDRVANLMAFPVFSAQAVIPILFGWVLDSQGVETAVAGILFTFSIPLGLIWRMPESKPEKGSKRDLNTPIFIGLPGILLFISAISSFALNWYFSSALTMLAKQDISAVLIGEIMSALNVAGIAGVGLLSAIAINHIRHQMILLIVFSLIFFPGVMITHSMHEPTASLSTASLLVSTGLITGVTGTLVNSIKFKLFDEINYAVYHRFLAMGTIVSALAGSLIGTVITSYFGWSVSLILCVILCIVSSLRPALSVFSISGKLNHHES